MDGFLKSIPTENAEYTKMLQQTQSTFGRIMHHLRPCFWLIFYYVAFNEFIHERETKRLEDPSIMLFDQVILAKKNRGKSSIFSKSSTSTASNIHLKNRMLTRRDQAQTFWQILATTYGVRLQQHHRMLASLVITARL